MSDLIFEDLDTYGDSGLESEGEHVEKFIDGFESIINQFRNNGNPVIGVVEGYTVGIMGAEGFNTDITKGFENFITNGIKKLYEMIKAFFKSIWEFFFGRSKAAKAAIDDSNDIVRMVDFSAISRSLAANMADYDRRVKAQFGTQINGMSFDQTLRDLEAKIRSDKEANVILNKAVDRLTDIFGYTPGTIGSDLMVSLKKYADYVAPYVDGGMHKNILKFHDMFHELAMKQIGTKFKNNRIAAVKELAKTTPEIFKQAESLFKDIERSIELIKNKAEREKDHNKEYEAQQALKATNIALRRVAGLVGKIGKNLSTIKTQLSVIEKNNVFGKAA